MDEKTRLRELIDIFSEIGYLDSVYDYDGVIYELNGWEGLLVWDIDGRFYQMSYKNKDSWSITMFPYDIYGKRVFKDGKWHEKEAK